MAAVRFQRFHLDGIHDTGIEIGRGSFGVVKELDFLGLKCVGKEIHSRLYETAAPRERADMLKRFEEECEILGRLHHPNVVQFLGVHVRASSGLPILVMEYLPTTLAACLDKHGVLSAEISLGILRDVAVGLCYLHQHLPPIIHRDLSANNVLLTPSMSAKISDLGVAKILDMSRAPVARMTQTQVLDIPSYMPPEAIALRYTSKVDIFSMGVLIVHVLSGEWPIPSEAFAKNPQSPYKLVVLSEFDRRRHTIEKIEDRHPLQGLIRQCLSNNPDCRPDAVVVVCQIKEVCSRVSPSPDSRLEVLQQVQLEIQGRSTAIHETKLLRAMYKRLSIQQGTKLSQESSQRMEEENSELRAAIAHKEVEIGQLREKITGLEYTLSQTSQQTKAVLTEKPLNIQAYETERPLATVDMNRHEEQSCKKFGITKAVFIKHIGQGSYGKVVEVQVNTQTYAAKMFYGVRPFGKFACECFILSNIKHPHIVCYCSICYTDEAPNELLLMMEKLDTPLRRFLLDPQNLDLNLQKKLVILKDVASGLEFLHRQETVIIHRDLTANNVFLSLTPKLVAKIADFGNARVAELESSGFRYTELTPGTLAYMPPEALRVKPKYGTQLDIFSFGHLALFTAIQISPDNLLRSTYFSEGRLLARSEIERREEYILKLHNYLGKKHFLVALTKQCLDNEPEKRPSAATLHEEFIQKVDMTAAYEQTDAATFQ